MNRRESNSRVRTEKEFGLMMFVRRCDVGSRLRDFFSRQVALLCFADERLGGCVMNVRAPYLLHHIV